MLIASLAIMAAGILIFIAGYSLRKRGKTSFIAGNNKVFVPNNEKKLAGRIGTVVMLFGSITILFPIVFQMIDGLEGYHFAIIAAVHLVAVFVIMGLDQMHI
ncbi:hypothetical protein BIV59_21570 [Bacillus sp. MUM 13]|nr:hypothetical protein BIV59_21570 [Bacillus sp. MUM 13]